jgi:hypothetical protein
MYLPASTGISETEYGTGCGTNARKRQRTRYWPLVGPVSFGARARSGRMDQQSSFCSRWSRSAGTASPGWGHLTSPCLLESRMRNESRKSGSGRGGEKPVAERRCGALRLLLHLVLDWRLLGYDQARANDPFQATSSKSKQSRYNLEMNTKAVAYIRNSRFLNSTNFSHRSLVSSPESTKTTLIP